jgi:hypothetical protein
MKTTSIAPLDEVTRTEIERIAAAMIVTRRSSVLQTTMWWAR